MTKKGIAYLIRAAHANIGVMDALKAKHAACEAGDEAAERAANTRIDDLCFVAGQYFAGDIEAAAYALAGYLHPDQR